MTEEKFEMILARQLPDADKRRRADFVIDTGNGVEAAQDQVRGILRRLATDSGQGENNA
jgi:dephospho-CoA kinase